ncbi:MAG TPA: aldehyde dehydrogenase family protein [Rhodospirillales bacterium]|nr:aldehyde dehydrogenase family protein [Rhodospirillales bacterium]
MALGIPPGWKMEISELFALLGVDTRDLAKGGLVVRSPLDGAEIARLRTDSPADVENKVTLADDAFLQWRRVPVPRSGELIHLFGEQLRAFQDPLARLVSVECGKILQESLGEVREMIEHLRLCRRLVAPASRPHHCLRVARAPDDGDLASAGPRRRDHRF